MKYFLALALPLTLAAPALAQAPNKARALPASQANAYTWQRWSQNADGEYNFQTAALQFLLRNQGFYKGEPSGRFNVATTARVKAFQRARGLRADGIVGPATWRKLLVRLKRGDRGDAVRALQEVIDGGKGDGAAEQIGVDGIFGAATEREIHAMQAAHGVKADGVVGAQTWHLLVGDLGNS